MYNTGRFMVRVRASQQFWRYSSGNRYCLVRTLTHRPVTPITYPAIPQALVRIGQTPALRNRYHEGTPTAVTKYCSGVGISFMSYHDIGCTPLPWNSSS